MYLLFFAVEEDRRKEMRVLEGIPMRYAFILTLSLLLVACSGGSSPQQAAGDPNQAKANCSSCADSTSDAKGCCDTTCDRCMSGNCGPDCPKCSKNCTSGKCKECGKENKPAERKPDGC